MPHRGRKPAPVKAKKPVPVPKDGVFDANHPLQYNFMKDIADDKKVKETEVFGPRVREAKKGVAVKKKPNYTKPKRQGGRKYKTR